LRRSISEGRSVERYVTSSRRGSPLRLVCILAAFGLATAGSPCAAQRLFTGSIRSDPELLDGLYKQDRSPRLELTLSATGDSNVTPLAGVDEARAATMRFGGSHGFGRTAYGFGVRAISGPWEIRWVRSGADDYEGNGDAARLYLAAEGGAKSYPDAGEPVAELNRNSMNRLVVVYETSVRGARNVTVMAAASWLHADRVQLGRIAAVSHGQAVTGNLNLLTTRGLPSDRTGGDGYALDLGARADLGKGWHALFWTENLLSSLRVGTLQHIQADVNVDVIVPDSDEFLHGVSAMAGRVTEESLRESLLRRVAVAVRSEQPMADLLMIARYDRDWHVSVGFSRSSRRGGQVWVLISPYRFQWQVGVSRGQWDLQMGWSTADPEMAYRGAATLRYRLPLGHSHTGR